MDASHFDDLTRSLSESRRALLGGMALAAAGWLGVADAKKKKRRHKRRKRKNDKPQFNQFGCVDVGALCFDNDAHCCSGICEGTGKTSRCVAHGELGCGADDDEMCSESEPCPDSLTGFCYRTTGKAGFCGNVGPCDCGPCQRDSDCEGQFGPGAACIVCTGDCAGVNGSQGTACVPAA